MENESNFNQKVFDQFMELFVIPEIKRRQEDEGLEKPYPLVKAQILFYPDGKKPTIRLNDEVKALSKVRLKTPLTEKKEKGDLIHLDQIEAIEDIQLAEDDDKNCGHATLIKIEQNWHIAFDFTYNKEKSLRHIEAAKEFINGAKYALENSLWSLLIDSLCSASELAAKAYLLNMPDKSVMETKKHGVIHSKINTQRRLGNVAEHQVDAFNKLWKQRNYARYLEGEIEITETEGNKMIEDILDLINTVEARLTKQL